MLPFSASPRCATLLPLLLACAAAAHAVSLPDADADVDADADAGQELGRRTGVGPDIVLVWSGVAALADADGATECNNDARTCDANQWCNEGWCDCLPGYHFTRGQDNRQTCLRCPTLHQTCVNSKCCFPADNTTRCFDGVCQCETSDCGVSSIDEFKLATQIALVSAIILVIACLLVILWKTCRNQHSRRRIAQRRSDASAASLTSVQLRVIERLRNRPPAYHDRSHIRIEKPPSYEETLGQPLRYPALILDPTLTIFQVAPDHLNETRDFTEETPSRPAIEARTDPSDDPNEQACPAYADVCPAYVETAPGAVESPGDVELTTMTPAARGGAESGGGGFENSAFVGDDDYLAMKEAPAGEMHM